MNTDAVRKLRKHTAEADDHVLVVPIIESIRAVADVPRMYQVEGVDVFFFAPPDFSSTAGFRGQPCPGANAAMGGSDE